MADNQSRIDGISIRVDVDNTGLAKEILRAKKKKILHAWGVKWKEIVTYLVPVDTGRLRQSMHFRVQGLKEVAVGTNVEYAIFINNGVKGRRGRKKGTKRKGEPKSKSKKKSSVAKRKLWDGKTALKFMEKSIIPHKDKYESIAKAILKE